MLNTISYVFLINKNDYDYNVAAGILAQVSMAITWNLTTKLQPPI